ncbi:hypothetical protein HQQ81_13845 [Microbacteriaceae bacterium VKM Ac-2854]|nr:hypothetical protein [Microbacteriaceae bacterium VKM Ac-2854]
MRAGTALMTAATVSYTANCALGTAVATGAVHTGRWHWTHHALYICTSTLTAAAATALLAEKRPAGRALLPASVPLAIIPFAGTHGRRHPVIALAAAPFIALALAKSLRD